MQERLVGKALPKLSKCWCDLAGEILTFLGIDGMLNTRIKKLSESETLMLIPNQAPKFSALFVNIALSGFCVALKLKSAAKLRVSSGAFVRFVRLCDPGPHISSKAPAPRSRSRARPHRFGGDTGGLRRWGQLCKDG